MLSAVVAVHSSDSILLPSTPDLVWGTISFVVVLAAIIALVLPNVNRALDARRDAIEGGIARAEDAQLEAKAALEKYNSQLADARAEAAKIREQARDDAKQIQIELREQAQAEAARIAAQAQAQIEAARAAAVQSLRTEVGSLALQLASGVIGEHLSDDEKATALVDRFLADLEASEAAKKTGN